MGLIISKPSPSGATATYHRVGANNVDHRRQSHQVTLDGYVDKDCRNAGKQPLCQHTFELPYRPELADGGRAAAYTYIVGTHVEGEVQVPNFPGWENAAAD